MGLILACPTDSGSGSGNTTVNKTPTVSQYDIEGTSLTGKVYNLNDPLAVSIKPKSGMDVSPGAPLIKYNNKTDLPVMSEAGIYNVTFDIPAAKGWNAVEGLSAGVVVINDGNRQTPRFTDFTITGLPTQALALNDPFSGVTVTQTDPLKTQGTITVKYLNAAGNEVGASDVTKTLGDYDVRFDVALTDSWNAATFRAGTIYVVASTGPGGPQTVTALNYDIKVGAATFNGQATFPYTPGTSRTITATPKDGAPTILSIKYDNSETAPVNAKAAGYAVTFTLQPKDGWILPTGDILNVGTLIISQAVPISDDFTFGKLEQTAGSKVEPVTVTPKAGKSNGAVTVFYKNNNDASGATTTVPQAPGNYAVSFNVAVSTDGNYAAAQNLFAGVLVLAPKPDSFEVTFNGLKWDPDEPKYATVQYKIVNGKEVAFIPGLGRNKDDSAKPGTPNGAESNGAAIPDNNSTGGGKLLVKYNGITLVENVQFTVADVKNNTAITPANDSVLAQFTIKGVENTITDKVEDITVYFRIGLPVTTDKVTFEWLDKDDQLTTATEVTVRAGGEVVITKAATASAYTVRQWRLDGVTVPGTADTYTFSSKNTGQHTVSLVAQHNATGRLFNTVIIVTVTPVSN